MSERRHLGGELCVEITRRLAGICSGAMVAASRESISAVASSEENIAARRLGGCNRPRRDNTDDGNQREREMGASRRGIAQQNCTLLAP